MLKSHAETDLLLLHAPSVYDFREYAIFYGPVTLGVSRSASSIWRCG